MKALSLFANVGLGEYYLDKLGVEVTVANELVPDRAALYRHFYPNTNMIEGSITDPEIYKEIVTAAKGVDLIIATPPCQGMSMANATRLQRSEEDPRNFLIKKVVDAINDLNPKYVLIENVAAMANTFISHKGTAHNIMDYIREHISADYQMKHKVLNAADYETPQYRKRLITMLSRDAEWVHPPPVGDHITVQAAIGHLPSLESDQKSDIPWHFAKIHNVSHIEWMKHTPTGCTAFDNPIHYPKTRDKGTGLMRKIKGFKTTYKRIKWDKPAPTVTMLNGSINSQNNVHPGRLLKDGTYSDARALSIREVSIICGLPANWLDAHQDLNPNLVRKVIGELFPPKMCYHIVKSLTDSIGEQMDKNTKEVMFSSKNGAWSTPNDFFEILNKKFGPFNLDPCATAETAKCLKFYTEDDDGLSQDWTGHTVFVNPPYGRGIDKWIAKAYNDTLENPNLKVVMLIPARTDTRYWHNYVMKATELYFVKGRLKFGDSSNSAPFPSAVVVFHWQPRFARGRVPVVGAL
tara:strand:+ start:8175 stop:9737 length:1563 start_codon:yes stop_codon:yes gene_type:complete